MSTDPSRKPVVFLRRRWRTMLLVAALGVLLISGRPAWHLLAVRLRDQNELEPLPSGMADDASRLNRTAVADVWPVPADPAEAERQLVTLIQRARRDGLKISIAGARHSMGGHTIYPGGIVIDMLPFRNLSLDREHRILHAQAGAKWSEIIPFLDRSQMSVAVMQSNDSFSVGGSISVNCHGWQHNHAPIASTVESLRLLKADGSIVRCSREENQELFSLALGGYGLFGVILDVDLQVVPNERYRVQRELIATDDYLKTFKRHTNDGDDARMVYGRLSVDSEHFLDEALLTIFRAAPADDGTLPGLSEMELASVRRTIFRGSVGSDYGKELRWEAEKQAQQLVARKFVSRNQLLHEGADIYGNRSAATTDILHEYFVPPDRLNNFLSRVREVVPRHGGDLLNLTIRNIYRDDDTFLRYADRDMFALVMLFNQSRTAAGESTMQELTGDLINAARDCEGRYYLPYRLHASEQQFHQAYPQAAQFFELKRQYDPDELFQNQFYLKYGLSQGRRADTHVDNAARADD